MKISNIDLGNRPVLLAPMEDVTDQAFRLLCKEFGATMVYSEFANADALIRMVNRSLQKIAVCDEERPVAIQIYGREVGPMVEAAKIVEEQAHPDIIDINFGCPVKKVAGKGAGAGLLKDIPKMLDITRAVVKAVQTPVTVKTRLGWDDNNRIITEIAEPLQDCGITELAIHGRTRSQMYRGDADWSLIREVKNNPRIHIPIIGNGDVTTPEQAKKCFDEFGVDAIMVGRATFGCPWIFEDMQHYLSTGELLPPRTMQWCVDILKEHVERSIEWIGDERKGIVHSRRHFAASPAFKGLFDFRQTRIALLRADTKAEVFQIMDEIVEKWGNQNKFSVD